MKIELIQSLPRSHRDLIELLKWDDALTLLGAHGGTKIYISRDPSNAGDWANYVSALSVMALCEAFGPGNLELPKVDKLNRLIRDQEIISKFSDGKSINALSREYRISYRMISNILHGHPDDLHAEK